jgi:glutathione S-transferase
MGLQHDLAGADAVAAKAGAAAFCRYVETQLTERQYLAGGFGYADVAFYMAQLFGERMGAPLAETTPKLVAWRARLTQRPSIAAVMTELVRYLVANGRVVPDFIGQFRPA